jgi:hypothetical protein
MSIEAGKQQCMQLREGEVGGKQATVPSHQVIHQTPRVLMARIVPIRQGKIGRRVDNNTAR